MKGSRRSEMIISDDLEWVEQHHRNTTRKSMHSAGHNQLPASYDFAPSGDESDAPEKNRQSMYYHSDPQKLTKEYHIDQAIQAIQLLKAASKPVGWKKVLKHKSGCLVYQSTGQQDKHPAFKGEHVIRGYRAQDVFSVVGVRKLWDDWYDELSCVESYDDATNLMYMVMKGTMSSKTRDISMVERIEVERDGTIYFASCSVESNKIPRISGKVRADIFVAGWIIQPLPSNPPITKITYVIQTDLLSRLPKFIARRALAKRPLVITTIETHLKKNGVPMVMSTLVSQTANRHRSLSEPLKPEKFLFSPQESEENIQSGSAFLSPLKPTSSDKEEQLNDKEESGEEDLQLTMASVNGNTTARNSLAPSLMSTRSLAPSLFTPEFLENNAFLGDNAFFGDSLLFGKGGIYESTAKQQDQTSTTSNEETRARSPQLTQAPDPMQGRIRQSLPLQTRRTLPSGVDFQHRHSTYRTNSQTSLHSRSIPRNTTPSTPERAQKPHVITPATPPLTPTTSTDGKEAASDSDASSTPKVRVVPRAPKAYTTVDTSLPARPSSMAFHAFGMRSPSAIMEERRHSAMITRSASFAPRHSHVSHVMPMRGNSSVSLQSLSHRSSMPVNPLSNSMNKRHSIAPSVDSSRSSTLLTPMLVLPHRHSETARKALAMFKVLASSPEDRWRAVSSDGVFKSYSRVISGAGLPMLRGEGVITGGWTVEQINAVIESSGCREIWDERFENMSIAETFNSNEYLFHVTLRGIGSLTGRDLAGVTIIDRDPQTSALYNVSTSVLDSTIPEDPGRIRALLELSGWSLRPTFDGQGNTIAVNVTFVIQVDIRGMLPNSVVKSMTASMMTAVPRLNQFMNKTGYPPYAASISGTRLLDTFDPTTGSYELCFKAAPGWTEVRIGRKVYKDGYDFFIKPDDPTVRVELAPDFGGVRVFTTLDHEGQSIVAQVTRKGQSLSDAAAMQQQPHQVHEEEDEEDHSSGRRMRHSAVPRRPRDSRVFDSSTPSYGGPSLRKSSSHLKSNDLTHSSAQVDEGSSAATGSGSDLRPHGAPPSISRRRRSSSYTTLSAFDPNLVVASSSDRSVGSQASMVPRVSQGSERSRSRSRTPRSLVHIPAGAPSPPLPRRSSSLSRHSIPLFPFLPLADVPPLPINTSIIIPTRNKTNTQHSLASPASLDSSSTTTPTSAELNYATSSTSSHTTATSTSSDSTAASSPTSCLDVKAISSPLSSPTLGPFHIPVHSMGSEAIELVAHSPIDDILPLTFETACHSSGEVLSVLQPPAEIPTSLSTGPASLSDGTALMSEYVRQRILEKQQEEVEQDLELELEEEQDPHAAKGMEVEQETSESLAIMTSPDSSPLPAPTQTPSTPEPVSRLKSSHSSSLSSAGGVRRVTFSPDVVDNSENRSSLGRVRRKTRKNSNTTTRDNALLTHDAVSESKDGSDLVTESALESLIAKKSPDDQAIDSDEAEFAEALSEFPGPVAEIQCEDKHKVGANGGGELMTMDHLLEQEPLWQTAVELFLEELSSTQIKVAVMLVLLTVYVSGICSSVL
ncbi:hypothetical protein BGZ75_008396 [Mortierella antarctica]|nr:hypothetical protein BGZ75_008396 [Mortierella antarctica]